MSEYLYLEPDQLRASAQRHEIAAAKVREWGTIPRSWLDDYQRTHGTIAEPMRLALENYYQRRHDKAERQADNHERTRDTLLEAARAMEEKDRDSGADINRAGVFDGAPSGSRGPSTESTTVPPSSWGTPLVSGGTSTVVGSAGPAQSGPAGAARSAPAVPPRTGNENSEAYSTPSGRPGEVSYSTDRVPPSIVASAPGRAVAAVPPPGALPPPAAFTDHPPAAGPFGAVDANSAPAAPPPTGAPPVSSAPKAPTPVARGPLFAATRIASDRQALPSLVMGELPTDDLLLARTLLAATLSAVSESAPDAEWAAAVIRIRRGPLLLLTSNEGCGWLPAGLYLPAEVSTPWKSSSVLGDPVRRIAALAEGVADPARKLAELGEVFRRKQQRISALASSTVITSSVRRSLDADTAIAERVPAAESAVDLGAPGSGLYDRLGVEGSQELQQQADLVSDNDIRSTCLALAQEANRRVRAVVSGSDPEASVRCEHRELIVESLRADRTLPGGWIDEIQATDAMMAAMQRSRQVDLAQVPVGARADSPNTKLSRVMFFERRAAELLLLLTECEPNRQTLRDMFYAYGQIVEHPLFPVDTLPTAVESVGGVPDRMGNPQYSTDSTRRTDVVPRVARSWGGPTGSDPTARRADTGTGIVNR